jgi:tetratricopeptide (TPR) repeat protein
VAVERAGRRLDSWKEIAVFFDRDERTVKRWEKERGLPVHRTPGGVKGRVFAYEDELAEWLKAPRASGADLPSRAESAAHAPESAAPAEESEVPAVPVFPRNRARWRWLWTVPLVGGALVLLAVALDYPGAARRIPEPQLAVPTVDRPVNSDAQDLYLKGRYYWGKRTAGNLNKAIDYFTQAIVRDPHYAEAYAGLADAYNLMPEYSPMPASEAYLRALAAASKAVEFNDRLPEAHASLAFAAFWGNWDIATANREFQRALQLNPADGRSHHWYATSLMSQGRFAEALNEIDRAQLLEPDRPSILADKGLILFYAGHVRQAVSLLQQVAAADPSFISPHRYLSYIFLSTGQYAGFLAQWEHSSMLVGDQPALAVIRAGQRGLAEGGSRRMLEDIRSVQTAQFASALGSPYELARTCSLLGDTAAAFRYLRQAIDRKEVAAVVLSIDPNLANLRHDPAYAEILKLMGHSAAR